jgi:transcription elongation factor Elf1
MAAISPLPIRALISRAILLHNGEARQSRPVSDMEHQFQCPYCGEEISMVLDLSVRRQSYVEDCEVCCKPVQIRYTAQDGELVSFDAHAIQ